MSDDLEIKLKSFETAKGEFFDTVAKKIETLAAKLAEFNLQDCEIISEEDARSCETCGSTAASLYIGPNGCKGYTIYEIDENGDNSPISNVKEHLERYVGCCRARNLILNVEKVERYVQKHESKYTGNADFSKFFEL